jgi:aminoglycoside phosphotransferase (APT) family kinase protein
MARHGLALERVLSNDGDSFVTLLCRDRQAGRAVLKYVRPGAPRDAYRRLRNETRLMHHLRPEPPLRLLRHRGSDEGHVVSEFDQGRLLTPAAMTDARIACAVARALAAFQASGDEACAQAGVQDREGPARYYVKVLLKHLLHLWPGHLSAWDSCRAAAAVAGALPAMVQRLAASHGDFLPTNLLYHDDDGTVTFTDLESFTYSYHPLFDAVAICTIDGRPLSEWEWQHAFFRSYLAQRPEHIGPEPGSREFRRAYRGILVFFLVYRLNEARINLAGGRYFDGLSQGRYLGKKIGSLLARRGRSRTPDEAQELTIRRRNLQQVLSRSGFQQHLRSMPFETAGVF